MLSRTTKRDSLTGGTKQVYTTGAKAFIVAASTVAGLLFLVALMFFFNWYYRYQARANANNRVKVSAIEIKNQEQRIQVTKQQAQIRYQRAIGIRESQDEIAKTLTPLYVQFEMIDALRQIAQSGSNSSVIYIPTSDKNGLAAVPTLEAGRGK